MWPSRSAVVTLYIVHTIQSLGASSAAVVLLLRAVWGLPPPAATAPLTHYSQYSAFLGRGFSASVQCTF